MADHWKVYAIKYGSRPGRSRADSFVFDDHPAAPHGIDYFVWLLARGPRRILVDTGYDAAEARRRGRPIDRDPADALAALGVEAAAIDTVIVTHLHYDHAGGLDRYPAATFHLQAAEMAFATGPCMCHDVLRMPFTAAHVCAMVERLFAGRLVYHDGSGEVAPGVRVHRLGGHSRGLQAVEVETAHGPLVLASDGSHYYRNFRAGIPFPIVVDVGAMLDGFSTLRRLAGGDDGRVVPGHDPIVTGIFPPEGRSGFVWRLDPGPVAPIPEDTAGD